MKTAVHASLIALVLAGGLSACGYRGGLERPAPLFGEDHARFEAEEKAKKDAEEAAKSKAGQPPPPPPPPPPATKAP
jgi:predicted small lipoprotein YifL